MMKKEAALLVVISVWFAFPAVMMPLVSGCIDGAREDGAYETNTYEGAVHVVAWPCDSANATGYSEAITIRVYEYVDYWLVELNNSTAIGDIGSSISLDGSVFVIDAETIWSGEGYGLNRLSRRYAGSVGSSSVTGVFTGLNTIAEGPVSICQTGTFSAILVEDY